MKGNIMIALCMALSLQATAAEKLIQTRYSKKIIRYVNKHLGKRVGNGVCQALTDAVMQKTHTEMAYKFALKKGAMDYISVGDLLVFSGTRKADTVKHRYAPKAEWTGPMHIAIVVGKLDENTLIIAHQNVGVEKLKNSRVLLSYISVHNPEREEHVNVFGLLPRKSGYRPDKLLYTGERDFSMPMDSWHKGYLFRVQEYEFPVRHPQTLTKF